MKIGKGLIWILVIVVVLVLLKIFVIGSGETAEKSSGKKSKGPMNVTGMVVSTSEVDELIKTSGSILANEEVMLTPESSGRITELNLEEGSSVRKGDLLVKLFDKDLLAQAGKLSGQIKLQEEKTERLKKLLEVEGVSTEQFDEAQNSLNSLKAELAYVQAQILKTEVHAPFNGKIGLRYVSDGSFVTAGEKIATIQQLDEVKIDFSIPGKYAGRVNKGDEIRFTIEGRDSSYKGIVYATEPKIDASTRSFRIRAKSPNKSGTIYPGAFATIELVLTKDNQAIMIPSEAIIPVLKGKKVYIAQNGLVVPREVTTGIRNDKYVEILSGLNSGDTVITSGIMFLRDDSKVNVSLQADSTLQQN